MAPDEIALRDYQRECVDICDSLEGGSHLVQMATGLGKTVTFSRIARKGRVLFQFQEALHQCVAFFRVFRIDVRRLFPVGDGRITAGGHQERGQHREHAPQENRGIHLSFVACPGRESRVFSVSPVAVSR